MARTEIPVTTITRSGEDQPSQTDSDNGNGMFFAANNGRIILEVENTDAATQTIGIALFVNVDGQAVTDKTMSLDAGDIKLMGPFPAAQYNQDDRSVNVNPSVDTNLKIRAYKLTTT